MTTQSERRSWNIKNSRKMSTGKTKEKTMKAKRGRRDIALHFP
jgi:hypothetical protein